MGKVVAIIGIAVLVGVIVWAGPRVLRNRQLSAARGRWADAEVLGYSWTIETGCFGACTNGDGLTITVRDGRPVRTKPKGGRKRFAGTPMTIEELFARVEDMMGADGFSVGYDDQYGYPTHGSFDPSSHTSDDEWEFTVTSFAPGA